MTPERTRWVEPTDTEWPERLDHLGCPPTGIWISGSDWPQGPVVAVVGSRSASVGGLEMAVVLGAGLAAAGLVVASGLARGIDGAAHRGSLQEGGAGIAVLGCGIDVCYPPEHQILRDGIRRSGVIVAESRDRRARPWRSSFPRRNRIIAALADVVVVVEADEWSGALSTARWALDMGREVMAVPGSIRAATSRGTNRLIRDGARPVLETGDVIAALGWKPVPVASPQRRNPADQASQLLTLLGGDELHPEQLASHLDVDGATLTTELSRLEVAGLVQRLPGGLIARR